jgi:uncharacterized tellurite resistance protein B-like protein
MDYQAILSKLYHLVIQADGTVSESEIEVGKRIFKIEGLDEITLTNELIHHTIADKKADIMECIEALKKLDRATQIRCIAWMCVVADSDWEIDKDEWDMIYNLYSSSLKLPLNEIVYVQAELNASLLLFD